MQTITAPLYFKLFIAIDRILITLWRYFRKCTCLSNVNGSKTRNESNTINIYNFFLETHLQYSNNETQYIQQNTQIKILQLKQWQ